jgi:ribosomal-protein-alanine N-acetyltransferase
LTPLDQLYEWRYEPPYDFYDPAADPFDHPERLRYVCGDDGRVETFWEFTQDGDAIEIGIGLRPDLVGRGLGRAYLGAQLEFARARWTPRRFRLHVASWNERAIRLYASLGFREVGARHTRTFERFGTHDFLTMERDA